MYCKYQSFYNLGKQSVWRGHCEKRAKEKPAISTSSFNAACPMEPFHEPLFQRQLEMFNPAPLQLLFAKIVAQHMLLPNREGDVHQFQNPSKNVIHSVEGYNPPHCSGWCHFSVTPISRWRKELSSYCSRCKLFFNGCKNSSKKRVTSEFQTQSLKFWSMVLSCLLWSKLKHQWLSIKTWNWW